MTARNSCRWKRWRICVEFGAVHALEQEQLPAGAAQSVRKQARRSPNPRPPPGSRARNGACRSRRRRQESHPWARECSKNRAPLPRPRPKSPISTAPAESPASIPPQDAQKNPSNAVPFPPILRPIQQEPLYGSPRCATSCARSNERIDREDSSTEPPGRSARLETAPSHRMPTSEAPAEVNEPRDQPRRRANRKAARERSITGSILGLNIPVPGVEAVERELGARDSGTANSASARAGAARSTPQPQFAARAGSTTTPTNCWK